MTRIPFLLLLFLPSLAPGSGIPIQGFLNHTPSFPPLVVGDTFVVRDGSTDPFTGRDGQIARYTGPDERDPASFEFTTPHDGLRVLSDGKFGDEDPWRGRWIFEEGYCRNGTPATGWVQGFTEQPISILIFGSQVAPKTCKLSTVLTILTLWRFTAGSPSYALPGESDTSFLPGEKLLFVNDHDQNWKLFVHGGGRIDGDLQFVLGPGESRHMLYLGAGDYLSSCGECGNALAPSDLFSSGFESGDFSAWSSLAP